MSDVESVEKVDSEDDSLAQPSGKETIKVFGRIRPPHRKKERRLGPGDVEVDTTSLDGEKQVVRIKIDKREEDGAVNNTREIFPFEFDAILEEQTTQQQVFENVAEPLCRSVLNGYNATIFAYGQTGSGKTFTMTGGAERYEDRGIIPRAIQFLLTEARKLETQGIAVTFDLQYLEIYNNAGYDLLNRKTNVLAKLPKVTVRETTGGGIELQNLCRRRVLSEEEALNVLFEGDMQRAIAATPANDTSSRSHCIFTIRVSTRNRTSAAVRHAKLHLVDLAGSERVGKTGVQGNILNQACHINLSLHFLEQVIVTLHEKAKGSSQQYVPYRNSLLTTVLKDSLGGNSMTSMVATLSFDKKHLDESVSTCRFAQRVARITNSAILNESLDPEIIIERLKSQNAALREELSVLRGERSLDAPLGVGAVSEVQKAVQKLMRADPTNCSWLLPQDFSGSVGDLRQHSATLSEYENAQQHLGISISDPRVAWASLLFFKQESKSMPQNDGQSVSSSRGRVPGDQADTEEQHTWNPSISPSKGFRSSENVAANASAATAEQPNQIIEQVAANTGDDALCRRNALFAKFKQTSIRKPLIEKLTHNLKEMFMNAKAIAGQVNGLQAKISALQAHLRQLMEKRALLLDEEASSMDVAEFDRVELEIKKHQRQLRGARDMYTENFDKLKRLRTEILHKQHMLKKARQQLVRDFDIWYSQQQQRPPSTHCAAQPQSTYFAALRAAVPQEAASRSRNVLPQQHPFPGTPSAYHHAQAQQQMYYTPYQLAQMQPAPVPGQSLSG
ncbi:MAG: hypothetical protein MHM6MM_000622 [Cercozoa sp. M6MM]